MMRSTRRQSIVLCGALLAVAMVRPLCGAPKTPHPKPPIKFPTFIAVEASVRQYFASKKLQNDDLLSKGDVRPLFDVLAKQGWNVADREQIISQLLDDKYFMVLMFKKGAGRDFAHSCARFPGGYDRLDRLSRLPHGDTFIEGLIEGPDGYKMIEYMTETPGGDVLGQQVSNAPKGRNFNDPTGRIYTTTELLMRLRESYDAATNP